jgi:hypothetical protein
MRENIDSFSSLEGYCQLVGNLSEVCGFFS